FSSRRRHTRSKRDWSSDVCSSDLNGVRINMSHGTRDEKVEDIRNARAAAKKLNRSIAVLVDLSGPKIRTSQLKDGQAVTLKAGRSEERRVGKESSWQRWTQQWSER